VKDAFFATMGATVQSRTPTYPPDPPFGYACNYVLHVGSGLAYVTAEVVTAPQLAALQPPTTPATELAKLRASTPGAADVPGSPYPAFRSPAGFAAVYPRPAPVDAYVVSIIPTPALQASSLCGTTGVRCAADAHFAAAGQGEALNQ